MPDRSNIDGGGPSERSDMLRDTHPVGNQAVDQLLYALLFLICRPLMRRQSFVAAGFKWHLRRGARLSDMSNECAIHSVEMDAFRVEMREDCAHPIMDRLFAPSRV